MAKHYKRAKDRRRRGIVFALLLLAVAAAVYAVALKNQGRYAKLAEPEATPAEIVAAVPAPEPKTREWVVVSADEGLPAAQQAAEAPKAQPPVCGYPRADGTPLLAIVIDDGGSQMKLTRRVAALDIPTTWAIMPYRQYSKETAQLAASKSVPYILHLPMQAQVDKDSETGKFIIGRGMTADEVRAKTEKALDSLPGVAGVNNHRGSRATESRELMAPFMQVLKSRGLVFVDSRTTGKSVAYDEARRAGVPALQNRGFLDNSTDKAEIAKRFDELVRNAQKRGALLIICHFRPATVAFLEELNARYKNLPVRFVTVPEMLALTDNGVPKKK